MEESGLPASMPIKGWWNSRDTVGVLQTEVGKHLP